MTDLSAERFWAKVDKRGNDECWPWTGTTTSTGYGRLSLNGEGWVAHRYAYELLVGPIPEGMEIDHLCHDDDCRGMCSHRGCVNPAHLRPASHRENTLRGNTIPAMHAARTHCPQGHPYSPENTGINKKAGGRYCRACKTIRSAIWRQEQEVGQ